MDNLLDEILVPDKFVVTIEVVRGNIVEQDVDAIVNAAHEGLCGGGGVDGAIHKSAGSEMTGECMNIPTNYKGDRCPVGNVRLTGGYSLPARYIIHTVGPVWRGGKHNEASDLLRCYRNVIRMANIQGLQSIAIPNISTGAFGFPKDYAAQIVFQDVIDPWLQMLSDDVESNPEDQTINLIRFVCFDEENYQCYLNQLPEGFRKYEYAIAGEKDGSSCV